MHLSGFSQSFGKSDQMLLLLQLFQEEEDSIEATMEGGRLDGNGDLQPDEGGEEREEGEEAEEGEVGDTRGLTRSALGPAVGEKHLLSFKKSLLCPNNLFPKY